MRSAGAGEREVRVKKEQVKEMSQGEETEDLLERSIKRKEGEGERRRRTRKGSEGEEKKVKGGKRPKKRNHYYRT